MASETPAPQIVANRLNENIAMSNPKDTEPVHIEFDLMLNPAQREVYNVVIYYTRNNPALRTQLIGLFMVYGASTALNELRKRYPKSQISISKINMGMYGRQL
jgi:hypothetical protein